jgi:hypothetical protein
MLDTGKYSPTLGSDITALLTNFQTKMDGIKDKDDSGKSDFESMGGFGGLP